MVHKKSRLNEIIGVLAKYGLVQGLNIDRVAWINKELKKHKKPYEFSTEPKNVRIRLALNELGTTFIKLGQTLSTREDLVGKDLAQELSKLQSNTTPDSEDYINQIVNQEHLREELLDFDPKPIASASVGQVHNAQLEDSSEVVVKIRHQGVKERVMADLNILEKLVNAGMKVVPAFKTYNAKDLLFDFRKTLLNELNFKKELSNLERFGDYFEKNSKIHFPIAYRNISSEDILVMSKLDGISVGDPEVQKLSEDVRKKLALDGANMYLDMIFKYNFYHADPHPGNIFIMLDQSLGILDCGMVGRLDAKVKRLIESMIFGLLNEDITAIKEAILELGTIPEEVNRKDLDRDIEAFIEDFLQVSVKDFKLSECVDQGNQLIHKYKISLPSNVTMLLRVLVMLEGTSTLLYADFNIIELLKSYQPKMIWQQMKPSALKKSFRKKMMEWKEISDLLPEVAKNVLKAVNKKEMVVKLEHENLNEVAELVVLGIVTGSLIIGGSMMISSRIAPLIWDFSGLGLLLFLVGAFLMYRLYRKIRKK
ncbi:MAG: ABC1 kinase family protein [Flavobacteriaceae bacterium]